MGYELILVAVFTSVRIRLVIYVNKGARDVLNYERGHYGRFIFICSSSSAKRIKWGFFNTFDNPVF